MILGCGQLFGDGLNWDHPTFSTSHKNLASRFSTAALPYSPFVTEEQGQGEAMAQEQQQQLQSCMKDSSATRQHEGEGDGDPLRALCGSWATRDGRSQSHKSIQ